MHAYTFQSGQWFHVLNAVSVHISTRKRPPRARASFVCVCVYVSIITALSVCRKSVARRMPKCNVCCWANYFALWQSSVCVCVFDCEAAKG